MVGNKQPFFFFPSLCLSGDVYLSHAYKISHCKVSLLAQSKCFESESVPVREETPAPDEILFYFSNLGLFWGEGREQRLGIRPLPSELVSLLFNLFIWILCPVCVFLSKNDCFLTGICVIHMHSLSSGISYQKRTETLRSPRENSEQGVQGDQVLLYSE